MNKNILLIVLVAAVIVGACKKEVINNTIVTEVKPVPNMKLNGVWKSNDFDSNSNSLQYFAIDLSTNSGVEYSNESGVKNKWTFVLNATQELLDRSGRLYKYTLSNDTLRMFRSPTSSVQVFLLDSMSSVANWVGSVQVDQTVETPHGINGSNSYGFGIDGNDLYFWARRYANAGMYLLNAASQTLTDSVMGSATPTSAFFDKGNNKFIYGNAQSGSNLVKTTGFNSSSSNLSTNNLGVAVQNISFNGSSGTVYAYSRSNSNMYVGTDGGAFTTLADLDNLQNIYLNHLCYYKNDEFLAVTNSQIIRCKIAPKFEIIKSYERLNNFGLSALSTNGTDIWVFGQNYNGNNKYEYRKITLKD